jgi:uncharacterized protein YqgV (UPF0045/DUF77 family)
MKRNPAAALLFMIPLIALFFVGCATVITYDQLPDNVPKGYVEFYSGSESKWGFREMEVWKGSRRIAEASGKGLKRRIARRPGMHTFQVRLGTAREEVKVKVIEGMITPVRVIIIPGRVEFSGIMRIDYFNMSLGVERPIPYGEKEELRPDKESLKTQSAQIDSTDKPEESDITRGLTMVSNKQYIKAISLLESGLTWLKNDPSYGATSNTLVSKETEYISKLIEQIREVNQKGVLDSTNQMATAIETEIETQAKFIKAIDDRRRSQTWSVHSVLKKKERRAPVENKSTPSDKQTVEEEEKDQAAVEKEEPKEDVTLAMGARHKVSAANEIRRDGRFIAYDNGTVLDTETKLMWAAKDNGSNISWEDAESYCEDYRGGGYTDWRMPTYDELAGLYDNSKSYKATKRSYDVHLTELIRLSACCPWVSFTYGSGAAHFAFHPIQLPWNPLSDFDDLRALPVRPAN